MHMGAQCKLLVITDTFIIKTLLGRQKKLVLPDYSDPITLASIFTMYFIDKIANIRAEFLFLESSLPPYSFWSMGSIMPTCANLFDRFTMITSEGMIKIVSVMNKTTCSFDPFPSRLLMSHLPTIIDTIMHNIIFVYLLVFSLLHLNQLLVFL